MKPNHIISWFGEPVLRSDSNGKLRIMKPMTQEELLDMIDWAFERIDELERSRWTTKLLKWLV